MRSGLVFVAAVLLLALAGCVPSTPYGTDSPESIATPVFTSDAAALEAAEAAYAAYLKVSDTLAQGGWKQVDLLPPVVRGAALSQDLKTASTFSSKSLRQVGTTTFDKVSLQSVDDHGNGTVVVTIYLCVDVTGVDIVNNNGVSVVPPSRKDRVPLEVDVDDLRSSAFKVSRSDAWSGTDFC